MSRMASAPMGLRPLGIEMLQKENVQSMFAQPSRPVSQATTYDTEFEEDVSDFEEYEGRRSEDSFGNRSNTTVSTFEELRTPASNDFKGFNFQLQIEEKPGPPKPVEGPVGPHLFRMSQDPSLEQELALEWSPLSREVHRADPRSKSPASRRHTVQEEAQNSLPLELWTPRQVANWMRFAELDEAMVHKLLIHDISGAIVKDLQFGDLKELGIISFGQRHQVWDKIRELRGGLNVPSTPAYEQCGSPRSPIISTMTTEPNYGLKSNDCSNPASPAEGKSRSPATGGRRRRARRALGPDDVISPGESASIVAIEQLLPKPHHCSKGENCSKWRKQQKQLARIAKEFPLEYEQISGAYASPTSPSEITVRPASEAVPSVVASSDVLGPRNLPPLQINEQALRIVKTRDPQENVRQFLTFQHLDEPVEEPSAPPYDMFPPLSPPSITQAPHNNLSKLPKLTIPVSGPDNPSSPNMTVRPGNYTPATALQYIGSGCDFFRIGSPASAMDVPVTAIPLGPVARDESQSVPPDMRFGEDPISRSTSRATHRQPFSPIERPKTAQAVDRSRSNASHRRQPGFAMEPLKEAHHSPTDDQKTPTMEVNDVNHNGWMKKRKTKMLRHEWHDNYFRLNGTRLAMHRDSKAMEALDLIDVDEYAVACSSLASNKLNAAFKSLKLNSKKKEGDASAFEFQLVPAAEKKSFLNAATGKTHHFAVKDRAERIDWMRDLMLAKALRQKSDGFEINVNGNMI